MKNLIKEIEGLKVETKYENDGYLDGVNEGVDKCLDILTQYNLITVPKSIKLSEIVDKLEIIYFGDYNIHRVNKEIYIHEKGTTYYSDYKIEILGNKMTDIQLDYLCDEAKWFYTLWITETEIIDDLEETK